MSRLEAANMDWVTMAIELGKQAAQVEAEIFGKRGSMMESDTKDKADFVAGDDHAQWILICEEHLTDAVGWLRFELARNRIDGHVNWKDHDGEPRQYTIEIQQGYETAPGERILRTFSFTFCETRLEEPQWLPAKLLAFNCHIANLSPLSSASMNIGEAKQP